MALACVADATTGGTSSSSSSSAAATLLMARLRAQPRFGQQLESSPAFAHMLRCHMLLHDLVDAQLPLEPAHTTVSDEHGVFLRHAASGDPASPATPLLRVQTLRPRSGGPTGSSTGSLVDWAHHTLALSPGYCYSKSSVFTQDASLAPHLELEMGAASPGRLLLYVNMDPKLSLTLRPDYLDRVYLQAPPAAAAGPAAPGAGGTAAQTAQHGASKARGGSGSGTGSGTGSSGSWMDLDARAAGSPGFVRFTSPSLHVRAFASTAILYEVDEQGWPAAADVLADAVRIWLQWCAADDVIDDVIRLRGASEESLALPTATAAAALAASGSLQHMAERSWAWRRFPRRERAAQVFRSVFGGEVMEDYYDSMAGEPRIMAE